MVRDAIFVVRGSSRFKIQVSIREARFVVSAASHGSRFTVHDSRVTIHELRVTRLESRKRIKKGVQNSFLIIYMRTKYYFTNDFK